MSAIASFQPADIRNVVLLGHTGAGKSTLADAILHRCGAIPRLDPDAAGMSTSSTLRFAQVDGRELNLIDTPGAPELFGQAVAVMPAVETAVIVVNAAVGIELGTRRQFHAAGEARLARIVVVNKIDQAPGGPSGLPELVRHLRDSLGPELHCINLPTGGGADVIDCFDHAAGDADFGSVAEVHREMLESTVEVDDAALERYLAGETIDLPALRRCFVRAMNVGHVVPILFTAASSEIGIDDLVHVLVEETPSPADAPPRRVRRGDEVIEVPCDPDAPLLAQVFKVTSDPYLGKVVMLRILQGRLDAHTPFVSAQEKKPHRAGHVLKVAGKEHPELESAAYAGDLVALARNEELHLDQILRAPGTPNDYHPVRPRYPQPMYSLALAPINRNDEVKLTAALAQLCEEDPTLTSTYDGQTHELVLSGLGELHLRVALERLEHRYHVPVQAMAPRIAYRETITAAAEGHHRHKKQTGGAGQFGEVFLRIEPRGRGEGVEVIDDVFGGAIPHQFLPSVEKGVRDAIAGGSLAGYPVQDVRVVITDGKTHPVDGKDVAFRTAGRYAFRDAFAKARPVLLEPIVALDITVPEGSVGDVTADLRTRRGRVVGVDLARGGASSTALIHAQAPLAELAQYGGQLRGLTSGQASFVMEPSHYDYVPAAVQRRIVAAHRPDGKLEED